MAINYPFTYHKQTHIKLIHSKGQQSHIIIPMTIDQEKMCLLHIRLLTLQVGYNRLAGYVYSHQWWNISLAQA